MKKLIYIILFFVPGFIIGQNEFDALRYSMYNYSGNARFSAMGNSFGALGANLSSLSVNPAGIGVYKDSDFSFTPAFHYSSTQSKYNNNTNQDGRLNFHIGNIGLAKIFNASSNNWVNYGFAIGYNRLNNFNSQISITGKTDSSALNTYVNELNKGGGTHEIDISALYPYGSNLAYQTWLVNPLVQDSTLYGHVLENSNNIQQDLRYTTKGGMGETYFTFGGNFDNKLFLGATIGVPTLRYVYERSYTETPDENDTLSTINEFTVNDEIRTTGAGVNLKLGLIYKVTEWLRVGTAFHTPTFLGLHDQWVSNINSNFKDGTQFNEVSPRGDYDYYVLTPYRAIGSIGLIISKYGVINADYELIDYSTARINNDNYYDDYSFSIENNSIKNNFIVSQNIRVGTEWRIDPIKIRAGYQHNGNPLNNKFSADYSSQVYSAGIGYNNDGYYFDIGYSMRNSENEVGVIPEHNTFSSTKTQENYVTLTFGYRF